MSRSRSKALQLSMEIIPKIKNQHGDTPIQSSYWVLFTKDVLLDSRNKSYEIKTVANYSQKGNVPYEVPRFLEAATSIFMEYVQTGNRLFKNYTRCQEIVAKYPDTLLAVGGLYLGGPQCLHPLRLRWPRRCCSAENLRS